MTRHVIIGGGPAATNAIETIRQFDGGTSHVTLISDEPAHSRMALPYWLSGQIPRGHTMTADDAAYQRLNVEARIGRRAQSINPQTQQVTLSDGTSLPFDRLLIATGSSPAGLPIPGADLPGVQPLWTLDQTQQLLNAADTLPSPRVVMIGADFISFIMLNAMQKRGWKLTVVEQAPQVLPQMLDADAAGFVHRWLQGKGIAVHTGTSAQAIRQADDGRLRVELGDGVVLNADRVIIAAGIRPNLGLAHDAGLATDAGILVNNRMQTSVPTIFAAGDAAEGPVLFSDRRAVHAIHPTAVDHGRVAGANMAGRDVRYPGSLLMNILDVCGLQCASFGNWEDARHEAVTISNPSSDIYRRLLWTGEEITGAIFIGRANDIGMLTDVGMVKGIMQTRTPMGAWKQYLRENPFDLRRPYIANRVAAKLVQTTLLGRPSQPRSFHFADARPAPQAGPAHESYVATKAV